MDENKTEEKNIYFTKRISKMGENLIISIPDKETEFSYSDLVKIVLVRKFLQEEQEEKEEKEKEITNNNK